MALNKKIKTASGVTPRYWRITHVEVDSPAGTASIILSPYLTEQARQDGFGEIRSERRRITVRDFDYSGTEYADRSSLDYTNYFSPAAQAAAGRNIYQVAYEYIKGLPEFEGATDI